MARNVNRERESHHLRNMFICNNLSVEISFSDWLQKAIDERGWSWNKLATKAGLSSGTIYNIRDGVRGVGEESLKAIAHALQEPVEKVYRAAGFLPNTTISIEQIEAINDLFSKMDEETRKQFLEYGRFLLVKTRDVSPADKSQNKSSLIKRQARSALKDK